MEITFATKNDIEGILLLQLQIYRVENIASNAAEILEKLIANDNCSVLVAKIDGTVVGTATIFYLPIPAHGQSYALLEGMIVDEKQRGKGIGTALSKKIVELAKGKNCYKIIFTSGMDRADIHKFYENLGFKKWGLEFRMDLAPQEASG
ncbi:MAG: GNAT family N-acetyltransferase [Candidatus Curtissbacteria bacterium]|nr:GNAT family N-acetyltransferase [Candidatus Curtissbacteria bacterium]MDZ4209626.1 GNAT family N-acetyltransferase [Candidatus Curtissbacteria bacterium]